MSESTSVTIEGAKEHSDELKQRIERQNVLEQASQMDNVIPRVIDEAPFSRDLESKQDNAGKLVQSATLVKKPLSTRKQAQLTEAREALRNKREAQKRDGKKGAQGTPAPDLMTNLTNYMDVKFEHMLKRMQDIPTVIASQAPLNQQEIPSQIKKPKRVADSTVPTIYHELNEISDEDVYMHAGVRNRDHKRVKNHSDEYMKQVNNNAKRLRQSLRTRDIYNQESSKRMETDGSHKMDATVLF